MRECPECGHGCADDADACPNCGYPLVALNSAAEGLTESDATTNVCSKCGYEIDGGLRFCPRCGAPLASEEQAIVSRKSPEISQHGGGEGKHAFADEPQVVNADSDAETAASVSAGSDSEVISDSHDGEASSQVVETPSAASAKFKHFTPLIKAKQSEMSEARVATEVGEVGPDAIRTDGLQKRGVPKRTKALAVVLGVVGAAELIFAGLLASNVICIHQWSGNTCEEVNHCVNCGYVDPTGAIDPDAHLWNEADCSAPRTCARCGLTDGDRNPKNHALEDLDGGGKICWKCGMVFGVPGSSSEEKASDASKDADGQDAPEEKASSDGSASSKNSYLADGKFVFSPADFCTQLRSNVGMEAIDNTDDEGISYALTLDMSNPDMEMMLSFTSMGGEDLLSEDKKYDSDCNPSPLLIVDTEKCDSAEATIGFIMACDSSVDRAEAIEVASDLADGIEGLNGSTTHNGIEYLLVGADEQIWLRAIVA